MKVELGVLQRTQMIPLGELEMNITIEAPEAIEVNGEELDLQVEMELMDLWDLCILGDFRGGMGYPPLISTRFGAPPVFNANLSTPYIILESL